MYIHKHTVTCEYILLDSHLTMFVSASGGLCIDISCNYFCARKYAYSISGNQILLVLKRVLKFKMLTTTQSSIWSQLEA